MITYFNESGGSALDWPGHVNDNCDKNCCFVCFFTDDDELILNRQTTGILFLDLFKLKED